MLNKDENIVEQKMEQLLLEDQFRMEYQQFNMKKHSKRRLKKKRIRKHRMYSVDYTPFYKGYRTKVDIENNEVYITDVRKSEKKKLAKKITNKKTRQYKKPLISPSDYRKLSDYDWFID